MPSTGNYDGRLVYLTTAFGGLAAKTIARFDGSSWVAVGPFEILNSVPTSGNFPGRLVMLSAANSGFSAWTLIRFDGSGWAQPNRGVDIAGVVPVSNNYAGRIVVLSGPDSGFNAWDVIRYNGSTWARIGPQAIPPGTEVAYSTVSTDTTTSNAISPGDTLITFSSATTEAVKYYFHASIPFLTHSAGGIVTFKLQEGASTVLSSDFYSSTSGSTRAVIIPFTPTAGAHSYTVTWMVQTVGTATIFGLTHGTSVFRIYKA